MGAGGIALKIGIITFHRACNCGAMLQAFALKTVLARMGHDVSFPKCNHVGIDPRWPKWRYSASWNPVRIAVNLLRYVREIVLSFGAEERKRIKYRGFLRRYLPELKIGPADFHDHYEALVFGSDQIWNIKRSENSRIHESALFLAENAPVDLHKISYAASVGEEGTTEEEDKRIHDAAQRLDFVSMREKAACEGLFSKSGGKAEWVLDPTMLLSAKDYGGLEYSRRLVRDRYVLVYIAQHRAEFAISRAHEAAEYLGCRCVVLRGYYFARHGMGGDERTAFGPRDLVTLVRDAEAVLSLSFHGTAFALIYNKPFVSLRDVVTKVEARQESLLRRLKCSERLVYPDSNSEDWLPLLKEPPSQATRAELASWREFSNKWLQKALA